MPYIGNVTTSSNVNGSQINNGTITGDKLSLPFDYDSATLYLDNTNNRVGVLTASPSSTLTVGTGGVVSIPLASAATPSLIFGTDTNTGIYSPGADQVAISTNGTGRLFVDASGKISNNAAGNNPAELNIVGKIAAGAPSYGGNPTLFGDYNFLTEEYGDTRYLAWMQRRSSNARAWIGSIGGGNFTASLIFGTNSSASDVAATERMRITSAGLVGIGTSSPTHELEVAGRVALVGTQAAFQNSSIPTIYRSGSSAGSYPFNNFGHLIIQPRCDGANRDIVFATGTSGANKVVIDSSGRVGIGTTSPSNTLEISKESNHGITLARPAGGVNPGNFRLEVNSFGAGTLTADNNLSLTTGSSQQLIVSRGATESFRVDASSRLLIGTSTSVHQNAPVQIVAATTCQEWVAGSNSAGDGVYLFASRSRGTAASRTVVQNGDNLARLVFSGYSAAASNFRNAAEISSWVDGEPDTAGDTTDMPGRLVFSTTSDGASSPTERLRVTSAGLVGVGTSVPNSVLHIEAPKGTAQLTIGNTALAASDGDFLAGIDFHIKDNNDATGAVCTSIRSIADQNHTLTAKGTALAFSTTPDDTTTLTERLRIDQAGRVGIGTSSPTIQFQVSNTSGSAFAGLTSSTSGVNDFYFGDTDNVYVGRLRYDHATDHMSAWTNGAERLRITSAGNVGIGTTSPGGTLEVGSASGAVTAGDLLVTTGSTTAGVTVGRLSSTGSDNTRFRVRNRIDTTLFDVTQGTLALGPVDNQITLSTNGAERARLDSSGRLLVGTSTISSGNGQIYVQQDANTRNAIGANNTASGTGSLGFIAFYRNGTFTGGISNTGSATAYNTSSDYRLKENVVLLTGASDRLQQIPVHRFNFIADPDTTVDGFIAHEVQTVVPECVTGNKDEVDDDNNPVYQGIDQSKLVPLLTAALQEAVAEIKALKDRVTALEGA